VECTQLEVPIDWSERDGPTFSVLIRRLGSRGGARQLWALDGGPGFAGDAFLDPKFSSRVVDAGLDLYVVSHRGSIGPSALRCPAQQHPDSPQGARVSEGEWPACLDHLRKTWGDASGVFSSRAAARDVAFAMERAPKAEHVLLFAGSYGTLWAHRLLLDTDARIDGALLDSIVPIGASLEGVDDQASRVVEVLLRECGARAECSSAFRGDPLEAARGALAAFDEGAGCGQREGVINAQEVRLRVRAMLDGSPDHWREALTLFAMLGRCAPEDLGELRAMFASSKPGAFGSVRYNPLLNRHLVYKELYRFEPTSAELEPPRLVQLAESPGAAPVAALSRQFGAEYRRVERPKRSSSPVPVTLLSGRLDPLDRPQWASDFARTLERVDARVIPWAGHSTLRYLGLEHGGCGSEVLGSFLATGSADLSCIEEHRAPSLEVSLPRALTREGTRTGSGR